MTKEEKAKAYDEALKIAKFYYGNTPLDAEKLLEKLFPQLAESDDEKMWKEIIDWMKGGNTYDWQKNKEKWIAYLEKQKAKEKLDRMAPIYNDKESFESALEKAWKYYNESASRTVDSFEDDYIECVFSKGFREGFLYKEKQKEQKPIKLEVYEVGKGTTICGQDYKCKKDYKEGNCWYIKDVIYHCSRDGYLNDQNGVSWSCTPEWFKEYIQSNTEWAEEEKTRFVSGQFLQCKLSFDGFKEGEHYWLEYVGDDMYVGRSDNILNQQFHITPRQLFTLFSQQLEEKQKEQKPFPKFKVGDTIHCKYDDREFTIKSVDLTNMVYKYTEEGCGNDIDYADEEFELVEQKPTECLKAERGGWYVCTKDYYRGGKKQCSVGDLVQAKGGMFMMGEEDISEWFRKAYYDEIKPVEWNNTKINGEPISAENQSVDISLPEWSEEDEEALDMCLDVIPKKWKTKSGILLTKWLKDNICLQPKQEWSEEDERIREIIILALIASEEELSAFYSVHNITRKECTAWLEKQKEQKPVNYEAELKKCKDNPLYFYDKYVSIKQKPAEWDKEDKGILLDAITAVDLLGNDENYKKEHPNLAKAFRIAKDWLEHLPERFNIKQNPVQLPKINGEPISTEAQSIDIPLAEWSEEDELMRTAVIQTLETLGGQGTTGIQIDWLKSLRPPQYCENCKLKLSVEGWKPSEEQMEAFRSYIKDFQEKAEAVVGGWNNFDAMIQLFEQLKKLM